MQRGVAALALSMSLILSGCASGKNDIIVPTGKKRGENIGPFQILGVISRSTSTKSRSDARTLFSEDVTINVPAGTEMIVPAMRGWAFGFGRTDPSDLSTGDSGTWQPDDHHFGLVSLFVFVERINEVDESAERPTQTAVIRVEARLSDTNGDDRWFGLVNYDLLCLGRPPRRLSPFP